MKSSISASRKEQRADPLKPATQRREQAMGRGQTPFSAAVLACPRSFFFAIIAEKKVSAIIETDGDQKVNTPKDL